MGKMLSYEKYCALIQYLRYLNALIWQFLSHKKKYSEIVHVFYVTILLTKRWKGLKNRFRNNWYFVDFVLIDSNLHVSCKTDILFYIYPQWYFSITV